jgi:YidC/Oxa1 family membrane protein insertase
MQALSNGMVVARMQTAPQSLAASSATSCVPAALTVATGRPACAAGVATPHAKTWSWQLYSGPKDVELLRPVGHDLVQGIDFGWFGAIALPMLAVLRWGHDTTGSWPVAILLLTLLVKALLWPITMRSMRSMKKMSLIKPELDKLRADMEEKAKKLGKAVDPNELNRATFELYRQHGVNPVGGCLPLLLQMPIYIALYRSINASVSLFNQPLFGWITDMTQKDPYYVLPLVLGAVMFVQQKVTPQAAGGDATQQKIMLYFMPVLFTLMMLGLPSGLTLYILANTVLSVAQTMVMQRGEAAPAAS